jgi:hypothetical protein
MVGLHAVTDAGSGEEGCEVLITDVVIHLIVENLTVSTFQIEVEDTSSYRNVFKGHHNGGEGVEGRQNERPITREVHICVIINRVADPARATNDLETVFLTSESEFCSKTLVIVPGVVIFEVSVGPSNLHKEAESTLLLDYRGILPDLNTVPGVVLGRVLIPVVALKWGGKVSCLIRAELTRVDPFVSV